MSGNVQLGQSERCQVFFDADSGRILGFGPDGGQALFPPGVRVRSHTCYHAKDIENYAQRYREQCHRDDEEATEAQIERERPIRAALRDAILQRNRELQLEGGPSVQWNIDLNNTLLRLQEQMYKNAMERRQKYVATIAAERYEAGRKSQDVALENPLIKVT
jgi:hypothetical protein